VTLYMRHQSHTQPAAQEMSFSAGSNINLSAVQETDANYILFGGWRQLSDRNYSRTTIYFITLYSLVDSMK